MAIKLRYFYNLVEGERTIDPKTVQFCKDSFNQSVNDIKAFFISKEIDASNLEIKIFAQNEYNEKDEEIDAIKCMLSDIKNENSCTYKVLSTLFDEADVVEKKISMARYLLENYFICTRLHNTRKNDKNFVECYHSYWGYYDFKYTLPKVVISKYVRHYQEFGANGIELSKMSAEELAMYVIPLYYHEIGWWDRETLRKDADKMARLATSWMD